jgi:hypothetical protein
MKISDIRIHLKLALALSVLIILSIHLNAQVSISQLSGRVNTITSAVPFLLITPDSRAGGMGDLGVATSPDDNSQHWNAAKYSFIKDDAGLSISYTPWLRALINDINISYLTVYKKYKKGKAFAASLRYFSAGNIEFMDDNGTKIKDHRLNEFAFDASYSMPLADHFSGAFTLRYINSNLSGGIGPNGTTTHPGWAVAGDFSLFYTKDIQIKGKPSNMSYGLQISNIGNKISYTDDSESNFLPTNLRIGGALTHHFDEYNSIMVGLDLNKLLIPTTPIYDSIGNIIAGKDPNVSVPAGMWQSFSDAPGGFKEELREITYSAGLEYWYDKKFALRTGYFYEHATKGNRKFFTVGVGLKLNVFQLDFAYLLTTQQLNPLANTMRFTLQFDFKGLKSESTEPDKG